MPSPASASDKSESTAAASYNSFDSASNGETEVSISNLHGLKNLYEYKQSSEGFEG